ncbi:hypothetical protein PPL_12498 [Heterostelium album PN500]|uniref:Uncharacterized protein n=1 Tax=Heterostelium pallidum (strain ATCC 26659 / Pp 5 / PN500) TaxID=670386 RepID=D3BMS5_HETP5|nr:hypothetical protein PPL_12498 [Heterostelium album PN500]EFA77287.1 hypothetical protein PPL_12498 [Heterostelium album PN500]|eukprot:XP_020429416.1 hypothetical protein PPL_12498 [Heterostelium album PN500]
MFINILDIILLEFDLECSMIIQDILSVSLNSIGYLCVANGFTFLAQENGLTEMTIRSYSPSKVDSNPFPGHVVTRIKGASTLNNNGLSWGVTAVAGTTYYTLLSDGLNYNLYGIDLTNDQLIINGYSPESTEMYVQCLVYDSNSEKLIGISPNSIVPSWFDVVELDQTTGAVKHKLETGKFSDDSEYSGVYAFDQTTSQLFIVFKQFDNSTQTTKEGIIPISTKDGKVSDAIWFTGFNVQDTNLFNLAYDPTSNALYGTTASYIGTERSFVRIDPSNGEITSINNKTEVCGGNGVIIQDGYFISPGHDNVSSNTIYYVSLTTGEIVKKHVNAELFTLISFLTVSDSSSY